METNERSPETPPGQNKTFTIIVNGTPEEHEGREITYAEVVRLAFGNVNPDPNICFTVTYARGHGNKPEGTLAEGGTARVKEGMVFNVDRTDKS